MVKLREKLLLSRDAREDVEAVTLRQARAMAGSGGGAGAPVVGQDEFGSYITTGASSLGQDEFGSYVATG